MARKSMLVESGGGLPVAPMVDVVLLLLIFFMLVSRYLPPSLSVILPEATAAQVIDQPAVVISITEEGSLQVDDTVLQWGALARHLAECEPGTQVRVKADRAVDYDYVIKALDAAAQAGLTRIALETKPGD